MSATILLWPTAIFESKKNTTKRKEENFKLFNLAGSNHGLSFSKYELLKKKIIGLDNVRQAVLIYEFENENTICINMKEVKNCTVSKQYDSIDMGTDKKAKMENHLSSIDLKFSIKRSTEPISISFYDSSVNNIYEMTELEAKAKEWETVLSKMIVKELKAIA